MSEIIKRISFFFIIILLLLLLIGALCDKKYICGVRNNMWPITNPTLVYVCPNDSIFVSDGKIDFIGKNETWKQIKSDDSITKCVCHCEIDGCEQLVIARTDGIYFWNNLIYSGNINPTSIAISDYFQDGLATIYIGCSDGCDLMLIYENGKWIDVSQKYNCCRNIDTKCCAFVNLSDTDKCDIVCLTDSGVVIVPNSVNRIYNKIVINGNFHFMRFGDFDNSGLQSIAVANNTGCYIIYNNGNYKFSKPEKIYSGDVGNFDVCDINENGRMDIVGSVILINRGNSFVPQIGIKSLSTTVVSVDEMEMILSDTSISYNKLTNGRCKKIKRISDMKHANENIKCFYKNGDTLTIQNIICDRNQLHYFKFGLSRSEIIRLLSV